MLYFIKLRKKSPDKFRTETYLYKSFSLNSDPSVALKTKLRQSIILMLVGGFLYPAWAFVHFMVYEESVDSFWERLAVYGIFLGLIAVAKYSKLSLEKKLLVLQSNRWILIAHYFSVVARNNVSTQYAIAAYFLVFIFASLFETPKYFVLYSLFILGLSLACQSTNPELPSYAFQLGLATCLLISFLGLANRYKLMTALKESEGIFRTMFETAGVGMVVIDWKGRITAVNKTLLSMLQLQEDELRSQNFAFLSADQDQEPFMSALKDLAEGTKSSVKFEHRLVNKSQEEVWGQISASNIKYHDDKIFILAMIENITEQKQAEKLIETQHEKLSYASKMSAIGEMAGGIAHEINTPLSIIAMSATLIRDSIVKGTLSPELAEKSSTRIQDTVHRIAKIIQGLRKFSRFVDEAPLSSVPVKSIIEDTMNLCTETLTASGVSVSVSEIPEDLYVQCRPVEISQVLLNLINNAKDANKDMPQEKWIQVEVTASNEFIRISVSNSGPKIPKELQSKIFQPFFTTKPVGQGTGLGLSISLGIVKSHHGTLLLDTEAQHTRFVVKLCRGVRSMEHGSAA